MAGKTKKTGDDTVARLVDLEEVLLRPAVKAFLELQLKKSEIEVRSGPGGSGWGFGNEAKREGIKDLNAALRTLNGIANA